MLGISPKETRKNLEESFHFRPTTLRHKIGIRQNGCLTLKFRKSKFLNWLFDAELIIFETEFTRQVHKAMFRLEKLSRRKMFLKLLDNSCFRAKISKFGI